MPRARFSTGWGIRRDRKAQRGTGAGGGGGSNNPASILGSLLHADFDAADPGIVLNAGNVASIPNRGTDTAAMVQATAANQPAFSATGFAGGPGMTFDGVNDTLACAFATPIAAGRRPMMWVVFKAQNTTASDQVLVSMEGSAASRFFVVWCSRSVTANFAAVLTPATGNQASAILAPTETANTHLLESADIAGGIAAFRLDSAAVNASPGAQCVPIDVPMDVLRLGVYGGGAQPGNSIIRRIIVANDLPSVAQMDAMRAYLRAQPYGLTF